MNLHETIILVTKMHSGQVDKQGQPYILHVLSVMLDEELETEQERIVALLHDTVEDGHATLEQLYNRCEYSKKIVDAVDALSRRKYVESYMSYIKRVKRNPVATKIKIADLHHNIRRLPGIKDGAERERLKARYFAALWYLRGYLDKEHT